MAKKENKITRGKKGELIKIKRRSSKPSVKKKPAKKKAAKKSIKPKKQKADKIKYIRYRGKLLNEKLSDLARVIRARLVKKGCFYSYRDIVDLTLKHVYWNIFYKRDENTIYPCQARFKEVIKEYVYIDEDDYFRNDCIAVKERLIEQYSGKVRLFLRGYDNKIVRYSDNFAYQEAIDYWQGLTWEGMELFAEEQGFDTTYSDFSISLGTERYTQMIFIDYMSLDTITMDNFELKKYLLKLHKENNGIK